MYIEKLWPNGYSLSGLWDAGTVDRVDAGVCGAPAVQVQVHALGSSLRGSTSAEMVTGGQGSRLVREENPKSFPHHVMELAREIEPPTCGLQITSQRYVTLQIGVA